MRCYYIDLLRFIFIVIISIFQVSNCQSDGDWAFFLRKNLTFQLVVSIIYI
nr:MAG TPA: hypothetical protein [Caudoviricetes sp.]